MLPSPETCSVSRASQEKHYHHLGPDNPSFCGIFLYAGKWLAAVLASVHQTLVPPSPTEVLALENVSEYCQMLFIEAKCPIENSPLRTSLFPLSQIFIIWAVLFLTELEGAFHSPNYKVPLIYNSKQRELLKRIMLFIWE